MYTLTKGINKPIKKNPLFIALILIGFSINALSGQGDSTKLFQLIKETRDIFIYPFAQGIYLSPYQIREHHRDQSIKNIEMVDGYDYHILTSSKEQMIPVIIKNNQTIIQKPAERFNSNTFIYHKDGRIAKKLRGRHPNDLYVYDEDGFLMKHGYGGEFKRAERKGKTFEWYNVKRDRLEYITDYDDQDRMSYIKVMGHYFGRNVEYETEEYEWSGTQLISKNTIKKYKEGGVDSTFTHFVYDSLGLITAIKRREDGDATWSSTQFDNEIEYLDNQQIKIRISNSDNTLLSITFDHYGNWVEMIRYNTTRRREIKYRKRKRRK